MSADTKIAELLTELHQLIKQTQVSLDLFVQVNQTFGWWIFMFQEERSRSEHNLLNIQKTHERMQTENKSEWLHVKLTAPVFERLTLVFIYNINKIIK